MTEPDTIKLLVFDVDGVLTDGSIIVDDNGVESKRFHVRDGFAIKAAMRLGLRIGVITGRSTRAVKARMTELGIDLLIQGADNKAVALAAMCERAGVTPDQTAYVGDDLIDLPAMLRCGYPIAVADAAEEVRAVASYVTATPGGRAAARDAVEHILKAQGLWAQIVDRYTTTT